MWKQPWPVYVAGFGAQALLLWVAAPLVVVQGKAPFAELPLRALPVAILVAAWASVGLVYWLRERRRNRQVIETLLAATQDEVDLDGDLPKAAKMRWWSPASVVRMLKYARLEEKAYRQGQIPAHLIGAGRDGRRGGGSSVGDRSSERLRIRLAATVQALAKGMPRRGGKRYLHQLPWYVAVGTSGAGRGFVVNDLRLQLYSLSHYQGEPLDGIGASTGCEWWFTHSAVILDAGGGDTGPRGSDWAKLLARVARLRRRPLDGIIVVCSLEQVLAAGQRQATVQSLLARIGKLQARFSTPLPVYILVSKTEHLEGFREFFAHLGGKEREEPWGIPLDRLCSGQAGSEPAAAAGRTAAGRAGEVPFSTAFDALVRGLRDALPVRLAPQQEHLRRIRVLAFADQFASLEPALAGLLQAFCTPPGAPAPVGQAAAQPEPAEPAPLRLRGLFFVSANQPDASTAIDRVIAPVSRRFGLPPWPPTPLEESGKNYFLGGLFLQHLAPSSTLAPADPRRRARVRWLRRWSYAAMALILAAAIAVWGYASSQGSAYFKAVQQELAEVQQAYGDARPLTLDTALLPALDGLAQLGKDIPRQLPWYLSIQRHAAAQLRREAERAYRRLLENDFLPRIMTRITRRLTAANPDTPSWRSAARLYLMLGDWEPLDPAALKMWLDGAWGRELRHRPEALERLRTHLDALLARKIPPLPLDDGLVEEINRQLADW